MCVRESHTHSGRRSCGKERPLRLRVRVQFECRAKSTGASGDPRESVLARAPPPAVALEASAGSLARPQAAPLRPPEHSQWMRAKVMLRPGRARATAHLFGAQIQTRSSEKLRPTARARL